MKRTPEQEAARRERQARERAKPRCSVAGCNQARTRDTDMCGAHRRDHEAFLEAQSSRDGLLSRIYEAETVDDMRSILVDIVERIGV